MSFRSDDVKSAEFVDGWEEFQAVNAPSSLIKFRFQCCIGHRLDLLRRQVTRFGDPVLQQLSSHLVCTHRLDFLGGQSHGSTGDVTMNKIQTCFFACSSICFAWCDISALPMFNQCCGLQRSQLDVRTAARHIGGNHHRSELTCTDDDLSFAFVLLCIENFVANPMPFRQHSTEHLAFFHTRGPNKHGCSSVMDALDFIDDSFPFIFLRQEDKVLSIDPNDRNICRNGHNRQSIDFMEFRRFRIRGSCHSREALIEFEVILNRDGRHRLRLLLDTHAFLCFDSLMQTV